MKWFESPAYKVWHIKASDYPWQGSRDDQIRHLLAYAVLAPSTFNSQPWLFDIKDDRIVVRLDIARMPKVSDKDMRFGVASVGCFIENLMVAAEYFGWKVRVELNHELILANDTVAILWLESAGEAGNQQLDGRLMEAMVNRATNRSLSSQFQLDDETLSELKSLAMAGQEIIIIDNSKTDNLIAISQQADMRIWSHIDFRKEHVAWVRNNLSRQPDGMPAFGVGVSLLPSLLAKPVILSSKFASIQAAKNVQSLKSTCYFVVICSAEGKAAWTEVGRTFERLGLELTVRGLGLAPMGQFVADEHARQELQDLLKSANPPQIFARINKPSIPVKHSPRLAVNDIMSTV